MTSTKNNSYCKDQLHPKCCKCRHILRWYVRDCLSGNPKPFFTHEVVTYDRVVSQTTLQSEDLYYLTICKCCDRHPENRPTWDDLVKLCPSLIEDIQSKIDGWAPFPDKDVLIDFSALAFDNMPPLECPGCNRYTSSGGKDYLDDNRNPVPVDYKYGCSCADTSRISEQWMTQYDITTPI